MITFLVVVILILWYTMGYMILKDVYWGRRKRHPKHRKFKLATALFIVSFSPFIQIGETIFDLVCYLSKVIRNKS